MSSTATLAVRSLVVAFGLLAWSVPPAWPDPSGPAVGSAPRTALGLNSRADALTRRVLGALSEEALQALAAGADPSRVLTAAGTPVSAILADALGQLDAQLVYTPLTPCRLIDTRIAGGPFAAGETRSYDLLGPTTYSPIGGEPAGCGLPGIQGTVVRFNAVRAVVVNIVAVGPAGPGDLRAYPSDEAVPNASVINYASVPGVGLNLANGIVLKTCAAACTGAGCEPCPAGDLSFLADVAGTHLVVDVVGYFSPANRPSGVAEGSRASPMALTSACQAFASCTVVNPTGSRLDVLVTSTVLAIFEHTAAITDSARFNVSDTDSACDGGALEPGTGEAVVSGNLPSGQYEVNVPVLSRLLLLANVTQTYYLNGFMTIGASPADFVRTVLMECFIP